MSERTASILRRPHKKARTGCTLCKKRRVKCGEEKPQCKNCSAHNATCIYEAVTSRRRTPLKSPEPLLAGRASQAETPVYTLDHMELLHHYTASTAMTLSSSTQVNEVWQVHVPRLALHADYVLHTLLAVSALHLSHSRPDARHSYWAKGVQLYQEALGKAQAEMKHITEKNCTELYLFSCLTCYYSLAELASRSDHGEIVDDEETDLLSWVFLFRGHKTMLMMPHDDILKTGVLAPMFHSGGKRATKLRAYAPPNSELIMDALRVIEPDAAEQEVYMETIQHLQQSFYALCTRPSLDTETTTVFVWLFEISDEYMDRLKRQEGAALSIFICFSLLVTKLQGVWWAKGWGEWISSRLRDRLLDEERTFSDRLLELIDVVPTPSTV
ncbi:hypothetical protein diail_11230 [Diaporthe ilicicola]|nr:hypothetical protein diail_11230 [Diaporthe ilicicola]